MTLTLNREFLRRHLFAVVILAGMGLWFGYDGFVVYPRTPAAELYESIEKSAPPPRMSHEKLEAFKRQKTASQHGFCLVLLFAAAVVGLHVYAVSRFRFAFDEGGFTWKGKRHVLDDIKAVDRSKWAKKGVLKLVLDEGTVTLDAWHHGGVNDFEKLLVRGSSVDDKAIRG